MLSFLTGLVVFAFGPSYSYSLVRILYGRKWSDGETSTALKYYCLYVVVLAMNGKWLIILLLWQIGLFLCIKLSFGYLIMMVVFWFCWKLNSTIFPLNMVKSISNWQLWTAGVATESKSCTMWIFYFIAK